jgi:hypothetical protein
MGKHASQRGEKPLRSAVVNSRGELVSFRVTTPRTGVGPTNRGRNAALTLGAAAGGLLGTAFLPVTMASADPVTYDYANYDLTPSSKDVIDAGGIRNFLIEVPPAAQGSIQGTQDFAVTNPSGDSLGNVGADVTTSTDIFGNTNETIYVTSISGAGDPPVGSLFDTDTYTSGFSTIYTDIPGAGKDGGDLITYSIGSPLYGYITIPTTFDALTAVVPVSASLDGDSLTLAGPDTIEGVNGIPPADWDLLGTQGFDVTDGNTDLGTITTDFANSSDILGNTTQDLLVTSSTDSSLPVGSVIDYFFSGSGNSSYNVYSDIPSTTGGSDTITDTIVTPYGSFNVPTTFDAALGLAGVFDGKSYLASGFDIPNSYDITTDPASTGSIVAIDGIQPEDIDVQGTQTFDWTDGPQTGTFDADVSKSMIIFGDTTQEQLVVTSSSGAGAPEDGSVFEEYTYASGYEQIYSDLVGAGTNGADKITDTFVTPFGSFTIPDSYDASAALVGTSIDPAAATDPLSSLDPSGAVDAGVFADLFPHAAEWLSSLF